MWLIITLIVVGLLLFVVELVLIPGISVAGIGAGVSLIAAIAVAYINYGFWIGSLVLTVTIILAIVAVIVSLRANTWQRLSLKSTIDSASTPTPQQMNIKEGERGKTLTRLAPMGKVVIGGKTIEAKSIDAYIDPHQDIEVIGFENTVVVVRLQVEPCADLAAE